MNIFKKRRKTKPFQTKAHILNEIQDELCFIIRCYI
jgi:hypothetical protein